MFRARFPGSGGLAACAALGSGWAIVDVILMTAMITIAATAVGTSRLGPEVLRDAAAAVFPVIYIGLPLGALAAVRATAGREAVLLIMAVIVISDWRSTTPVARSASVRWRRRSVRRRRAKAR